MADIILSDDNPIYIQEWVEEVEVIPLESSGNVLIGVVDGVIVTDENIIVYDTQQTNCVFIFGRDGKHRTTINRQGQGPQEYLGISHVAMLPDNKTIAIRDNRGDRVLYFSLDGRFVSSSPARFWFSGLEYIDDDNVLCATYGVGESDPGLQDYDNRDNLLWFTNGKFEPKGNTMPMRYESRGMVITPNISKFNGRVLVNRPYSDTIYHATLDSLVAVYRIDATEIGGVANFDPEITYEEFDRIAESKVLLTRNVIDGDDYLSISVRTPPEGILKNYLYSKRSGKVYVPERDYKRHEDFILWFLTLPNTSIKDTFVKVVPSYHILHTGTETVTAATQRPELVGLTEDSNPVVVMYKFRDGL